MRYFFSYNMEVCHKDLDPSKTDVDLWDRPF